MIAIGTNFFYTRTLPCMLWFFDKGKPKERVDRVLMIDARSIHRKVTRVINDFSPEQLLNISSIVWLHRGETDSFLELVRTYLIQANHTAVALKEPLARFDDSMGQFVDVLQAFGRTLSDRNGEDAEAIADYEAALKELADTWKTYQSENVATVKAVTTHAQWVGSANLETNEKQRDAHDRFEPVSEQIRSLRKIADTVIKAASNAYDIATKRLAATKCDGWKTSDIRSLHKDMIRTPKEDEEDNLRTELFETLRQPPYFQRQIHWLQSRFPSAAYCDIEGLCKSADRALISDRDWSLSPGQYVGVSQVSDDDPDFDFEERMIAIHDELDLLTAAAEELAATISRNFRELVQ